MVDGAALEKRWAAMPRGFESHPLRGEVLEWPIRRAWRARVAFGDRGFESHPLRQDYITKATKKDLAIPIASVYDKITLPTW